MFQRCRTVVEQAPGGQVIRDEPIGPVLGEARVGIANGNLLLHARVLDGSSVPGAKEWSETAVEVYIWTEGMPRARQYKIMPLGPDGRYKLECFAWREEPAATQPAADSRPHRSGG